jgi:hypothetical protein
MAKPSKESTFKVTVCVCVCVRMVGSKLMMDWNDFNCDNLQFTLLGNLLNVYTNFKLQARAFLPTFS